MYEIYQVIHLNSENISDFPILNISPITFKVFMDVGYPHRVSDKYQLQAMETII